MPIPDRQKQRREYLRKKTKIYGQAVAQGVSGCVIIVVSLAIFWACVHFNLDDYADLIGNSVLALLGLACILFQLSLYTFEKAGEIPYVPPSYQNSDLPADEILVRASQEPEQEQRTMLLRAAENADTPAEELLRASNSATVR